uniref:Uncharacterized protein n=1 Tax=Graphocephala atropunctata TaxID=36148 RepID=A0A1B6LDC9_9HEMI
MSDLEMTPDRSAVGNLQTVQSAYKKTLESAEKLNSPTSDELVRRFSRELKIRGSSEKKVIRSPSARKIGSLRRRSKENAPQIKRNLSLNVPSSHASRHHFYPINSLRRGKPNTVSNGLPDPLFPPADNSEEHFRNFKNQCMAGMMDSQRESLGMTLEPCDFDLTSFGVLTRSQTRRASSFHGCDLSKVPTSVPSSFKPSNRSSVDTTIWKNAEDFLKDEKPEEQSVTGRPSVLKLRSQNAGMVMAKAKLFNTMVDSDGGASTSSKSKSANNGSKEIKKRNSSKSSKERKVQKKDSKNSSKKVKRDNSVPKQQPTDIKPMHIRPGREEIISNVSSGKENLSKTRTQVVQNSLSRTPLWVGKNVQSRIRENTNNVFTPVKNSPLRERNNYNSPRSGLPRHSSKFSTPGKSPRVTCQTLTDNRATLTKNVSYTPRRSPRQLLLKSRHNNLNCK